MTDGALPPVSACYPSLAGILRKYDRYARQRCFTGATAQDFELWRAETRDLLRSLLGWDKMDSCALCAQQTGTEALPGGITRQAWRIQVEPDVWMPFYLLLPAGARPGAGLRPFLCPPGHGGAGKYTVAGVDRYAAVREKIEFYNYDYGLQLARLGYVALCPDCRGFGERREELADTRDPALALKGDCYWLAHMGEPLGIPVAGMLAWDLARAADFLFQTPGPWDAAKLSCLGFSGGGMQVLWLAALDDRVRLAVISGYMYGYRDALLTLNRNCSCNYVPHLWEYLDMGDIGSLIAPRPLWIQSCRGDRLNGPRGIVNAEEQVAVIRAAYELLGAPRRLLHEECDGPHRWHGEHLEENLSYLLQA